MRIWIFLLILVNIMGISACDVNPSNVTPESSLESADSLMIETSNGDWIIDSVRLTDEVRGTKAGAGQTILLILLKQADGGDINPEDLMNARQNVEVGILGEGDNRYICTMGGLLESGETAIGCIVPVSMEAYKFYWGDNPIIQLVAPES